jgi:FkbM family methyltransferase
MIISYAQNFEDVMLLRALKHIESGFYIDVGANDPTIDSVTKTFYDRGWFGVNIEPLDTHFTDLERERPRDINIQSAVGAYIGEIDLWECNVRGWATANKGVIEEHTSIGHIGHYSKVKISTLTAICELYAPKDIHFLKIDVEGSERSVLEGMNFQLFRPWIVLVESIKPNSRVNVYDQWEDLLLASNYLFVYADGINRYYVAIEHENLIPSFEYPPNFLDSFQTASQIEAQERAYKAESHLANAYLIANQSEARAAYAYSIANQAEARAAYAEQRLIQLEMRLDVLLNSTSWKVTAPIRFVLDTIREFNISDIKGRIKISSHNVLLFVFTHPILSPITDKILELFPGLKLKLKKFFGISKKLLASDYPAPYVSHKSRQIYSALKLAISQQIKDNSR